MEKSVSHKSEVCLSVRGAWRKRGLQRAHLFNKDTKKLLTIPSTEFTFHCKVNWSCAVRVQQEGRGLFRYLRC